MHKVKGVMKNITKTSQYRQGNGPPVEAGRGGGVRREGGGGKGG